MVTCRKRTRRSAEGNALSASFNTNQEEPTTVFDSICVSPSFWKKGVIGWVLSSTKEGSSALGKVDALAGPANPMVAYVSATSSGNISNISGFTPEAFHVVLKALLYTPDGASSAMPCSLLP